MNGLSFTLVFGSYGGFHIIVKNAFRICLGWVAFTIMPYDLETNMDNLFTKLDNEIKQLKINKL